MSEVRNTPKRGRKRKKSSRWHTIQGKVVSMRFSDTEYILVKDRAKNRRKSIGLYIKWLLRKTRDKDGILTIYED